MSFLYFEDNELNDMYQAINKLQICFHPTYAPNGQFTAHSTFKLQAVDKGITVIADKNLVSPICEIARTGTLKDKYRLQKVALFVTWSKYLNACLTCGIGLLENDTSGLSTATGEENRLQFLHGVDKIPSIIWKDIAFGYRDCVPKLFLFKGPVVESKEYKFDDNLLLLCNETAMVKMAQLIRTPNMQPIEKFISFMNWYADNLDIAESIMVYAAMVFANIPNVSPPKKVQSKKFEQVVKGLKNQSWDITYITAWSMQYYNEAYDSCCMFATDDNTQKIIVINVIPPGECGRAIDAIFQTKSQREKLKEFSETKLGAARVRPFGDMTIDDKVAVSKKLLCCEYNTLERMCSEEQ